MGLHADRLRRREAWHVGRPDQSSASSAAGNDDGPLRQPRDEVITAWRPCCRAGQVDSARVRKLRDTDPDEALRCSPRATTGTTIDRAGSAAEGSRPTQLRRVSMTSRRSTSRGPRPEAGGVAMRGSVIKKGDRWYVKIELDRRPVHRSAPPEVALGFQHQARGRAGTHRSAVEVRSWRVCRADTPDGRRLLGRLVEGDRADDSAVDVRVVRAQHAQPRDRPHRRDPAHQGRRRCTQWPLRHAAVERSRAIVEEGQGLLARGRRARSRFAADGPDPAGHGRVSARRVHRGRAHHEGHARFPASSANAASADPKPGRPRSSDGQLHPHDPASCLQGRRSLGSPSRATLPTPPTHHRLARSPTTSRRGTLTLDRFHRPVTRGERSAPRACGCCSPRLVCDEAKRWACAGATSISTRASSASCRR